MIALLAQVHTRLGHPVLGVIIPGAVFFFSFWFTWLLYKHFSRRPPS